MSRLDTFSFASKAKVEDDQKSDEKRPSLNENFTVAKPPKRTKKFKDEKGIKSSNMFVSNLETQSSSRIYNENSVVKNTTKYLSSSEDEGQRKIVNTLKLKYQIMKDY
jgi:hypothetical protein